MKIYCAGPLFTQSERDEMTAIADSLVGNGYEVFLPHRDGLEFRNLLPSLIAKGLDSSVAEEVVGRSIFALDISQVLDSDGLVFNLNGRVPDEGTMVEAGAAWSAGKAIVAFKDDPRSLIQGQDNPLVAGLSDFVVAKTPAEVCERFRELFAQYPTGSSPQENRFATVGSKIRKLLLDQDVEALSEFLISEFAR